MVVGMLGSVVGLLRVVGVSMVVVSKTMIVLEWILHHHVILKIVLLVYFLQLLVFLLLAGLGCRGCGEVGVVRPLLVGGERMHGRHQWPRRLVLDGLVLLGLPLCLRPRSGWHWLDWAGFG